MITDTLRSLATTDAPICAALHRLCFDNAAWTEEQFNGSLALATTVGWSMHSGDAAIGMILCQQTIDDTEILTLGVHPEIRRRGLGWILLDHAIAAARASNHMRVFLEVAEDNLPAIRLYQAMGFAMVGKRPDYYPRATGPVPALNFTLTLG